MLQKLKDFLEALRAFKRDIHKHDGSRINRVELKSKAEELGSLWFSEFRPALDGESTIQSDVLERYSTAFKRLIKLAAPNNRKSSYLEVLNTVTKRFRDELILPQHQGNAGISGSAAILSQLLKELPNPDENDYLGEAVKCAGQGFQRAAVVLGWCAAIDRIHRRIEALGFTTFNVASAQMASQQKGRFKKFSSVQNVTSLSEIREVFDTVALWIIEGMGLVDSNQHTRLRSCFDMRCHCAHPGEAPITPYNLMSFFSDLNEIVFKNPKFAL